MKVRTNRSIRTSTESGSRNFFPTGSGTKDSKHPTFAPRTGAGSRRLTNPQFSLWIGCANYQEYPDGFLCFIEPHEPSIRKLLKKVDTRERASALQIALDRVLSAEVRIRSKRWWTSDDFM
jgi:hypothetical protein